MRVELLGTGGYFANDRRHTPCMLFPELGLAFDAGSSLFRISGRLPTRELNLFLTHAHLDHIVGLPYLLMPVLLKEIDRITVYGTAETLSAVQTHLFATPVFPVTIPLEWKAIGEVGSVELDSSHAVSWQRLPSHPGGSMAYRVDGPAGDQSRSVSYITDTCVDGTYTEFIRASDLLIHECNFPDSQSRLAEVSGHSIASDVARLAVEACVKRLIVVHVDPLSPEEDPIGIPGMQAIFPDVELGIDRMKVEL